MTHKAVFLVGHAMVYFIIAILWHTKIAIRLRLLSYGKPYTMELHGFSYHIPKALENAAKPTL